MRPSSSSHPQQHNKTAKFVTTALRESDSDRDGRVSLDDFIGCYMRVARHYNEAARQGRITSRRKVPVVPLDAPSDDRLKRVFRAYCKLPIGRGRQVGASVQHLNAVQFKELARDAGLVEPEGGWGGLGCGVLCAREGLSSWSTSRLLSLMSIDNCRLNAATLSVPPPKGPLSMCAVDIIFTRCRDAGHKRLALKEFFQAVAEMAEEAGCEFAEVRDALSATAGDGGCILRDSAGGVIVRDITSSLGGGSLGSPTCGSLARPGRGGGLRSGLGASAGGWSSCTVSGAGADGAAGGALGALYKKVAAAEAEEAEQQEQGLIGTAVAGSPPNSSVKINPLYAAAGRPGGAPTPAALADVLARLDAIEADAAQRRRQIDGVCAQQAQLAAEVARVAARADRDGSPSAAARKLTGQLAALERAVEEIRAGKGGDDVAAAGAAAAAKIERKLTERQGRVESALMQVARQVDVLDARLREEQETSLKALEAILAGSGAGAAGDRA